MTIENPSRRHTIVTTPIGDVTLVADGDALVGVYFASPWYAPGENNLGERVPVSADELLAIAARQLDEYLHGERTSFALGTSTHGDPFQERVWSLIKEIPFGETTTSADLAKTYEVRYLMRDLQHAIGSNPLSVIVPSHRVVGRDGTIAGYTGGLERKKALLEVEGLSWHVRGRRSDLRYLTLRNVPSAPENGGR